MCCRTVLDYYSGEVDEDAYDMRKALSRFVTLSAQSFAYFSLCLVQYGSRSCIRLIKMDQKRYVRKKRDILESETASWNLDSGCHTSVKFQILIHKLIKVTSRLD
jgi:hypothetical protein